MLVEGVLSGNAFPIVHRLSSAPQMSYITVQHPLCCWGA